MIAAYIDLARALRDRITAISDEESRRNPEAHMRRLQLISEKITALQTQLPRGIDPQLRHFLDRCSYDKALAFLEAVT